jgi:hypothetical protein
MQSCTMQWKWRAFYNSTMQSCTVQWKWTACCRPVGCYHSRSIQEGSTSSSPHSPTHHPNLCSLLLPRTPLCPKLVFDCSRPRTLCQSLLLGIQTHPRPSSGRSHHQAPSSKSNQWTHRMLYCHTGKVQCWQQNHLSQHTSEHRCTSSEQHDSTCQ